MQKLMAMRELKRARTDANATGGSRNATACPQERGNCYVARGRTVHVTGKASSGTAFSLVPDIRHPERLRSRHMRHVVSASKLSVQA